MKKLGEGLVAAGSIQDVPSKAAAIQEVLVKSLPDSMATVGSDVAPPRTPADAATHGLIQQRRRHVAAADVSPQENKKQRIAIGKQIQSLIRKSLAQLKTERSKRRLHNFGI